MTTRWRGRGVVERSWTWTDRAGITRALAERMPLRVAWRRLVPLRERIERRSLSFDRVPAVRLET